MNETTEMSYISDSRLNYNPANEKAPSSRIRLSKVVRIDCKLYKTL